MPGGLPRRTTGPTAHAEPRPFSASVAKPDDKIGPFCIHTWAYWEKRKEVRKQKNPCLRAFCKSPGLGATALLWVARRRGALRRSGVAITCIAVALAAVGVLTIRAGDLDQFLRFLHVRRVQHSTTAHVQTYVQHTLLLYVGYRIWLTHPLVGAEWRQSSEPTTVNPVLPAARREFPDVSPLALPTAAHEWGIQDAYMQAAADLGAIGFLLWLAAFAAAFALAIRAAAPPSESATFIVIAATGLWAGQGLVAGIPLDALTWLGFGLAATAAARASQYREPPVP
jgi:hypothetical protein